MSRLLFTSFAVLTLSGCSVLDRVDMTIAQLDTANRVLSQTNEQMSSMHRACSRPRR